MTVKSWLNRGLFGGDLGDRPGADLLDLARDGRGEGRACRRQRVGAEVGGRQRVRACRQGCRQGHVG